MLGENSVILGDNLELLPRCGRSFQLIYIDPPFNTGKAQTRKDAPDGARRGRRPGGLPGSSLQTRSCSRESSYRDPFDDYLAFLEPRLREAHRLLGAHGTFYFHIDYREAHYCKLLLDEIFGRECFLNEIIWAYDYGARAKRRWPAKHDTILVYVKDPAAYFFDSEAGRPRAVHGARARHRRRRRRGASSRPTCGGTRSSRPTVERRPAIPTQKPEGIVRRMVQASTQPGRLVPGLLRRQRHARRGGCVAGPALCADRLQSRGGRVMRERLKVAADERRTAEELFA